MPQQLAGRATPSSLPCVPQASAAPPLPSPPRPPAHLVVQHVHEVGVKGVHVVNLAVVGKGRGRRGGSAACPTPGRPARRRVTSRPPGRQQAARPWLPSCHCMRARLWRPHQRPRHHPPPHLWKVLQDLRQLVVPVGLRELDLAHVKLTDALDGPACGGGRGGRGGGGGGGGGGGRGGVRVRVSRASGHGGEPHKHTHARAASGPPPTARRRPSSRHQGAAGVHPRCPLHRRRQRTIVHDGGCAPLRL